MIVYDTETCGFHGPTVLIQYQLIDPKNTIRNNDDIVLHNVWLEPIKKTLQLIEDIMTIGCIGFNLAFDHFHLCQTYTVLQLMQDNVGNDALPVDHIDLYAELEPLARDGLCLKPKHSLDLMLYARKGPYQSTMERRNIVIRKIPSALARELQVKLDQVIKLEDVYFARRKESKELNWDHEFADDPAFVNLILRFKPSAALKVLAKDALGIDDPLLMKDVHASPSPLEKGWAPFAKAFSSAENNWRCTMWKGNTRKVGKSWPGVITHHISHWGYNELARRYATDDVIYTRDLYYHFRDLPGSTLEIDDDDSVLACQVAAARWRGFALDIDAAKALRTKAAFIANSAPKAPRAVYDWIVPHLSGEELAIIGKSTRKSILETLARMKEPCMECSGTGDADGLIAILRDEGVPTRTGECDHCDGTGEWNEGDCPVCNGAGMIKITTSDIENPCPVCKGTGDTDVPHPAAQYAQQCLDARTAIKEVEMWDKLIEAGRFHASVNVIGTLSGRMSGTDGLNAQGIKHDKYVREVFKMAHGDLVLCGGDFMSFEVSIIAALCNDPKLNEELSRCAECNYVWPQELYATQIKCPNCGQSDGNEPCRQKFHGLFAMGLKPGITYAEVVKSKGTLDDLYDKGKRGGFAKFYGGNENTLVDRGVADTVEIAVDVLKWFDETFPGSRRFSEEIYNDYCSMQQPGGIGTNVEWHDPKDYVESMVGFRRYFTIENRICKKLYDLSTNLPKNWKEHKGTCVRTDREQKISGATMSALFAAAFNIQAKNMRAAGNHRIQSTGATITKKLQTRLWNLQPSGVHPWQIQLLNIHDELMCPIKEELKPKARKIVEELVSEYSSLVPLIAIGWADHLESWADK